MRYEISIRKCIYEISIWFFLYVTIKAFGGVFKLFIQWFSFQEGFKNYETLITMFWIPTMKSFLALIIIFV